jgi:hypothetical protein
MAGFVHVPWYATGFRGDKLQAALIEITSMAPRYGATGYSIYRGRDDRYRLLQMLEFEDKLDWERYWEGPEFSDFRTICAGWYQIPVLYSWHDRVAFAELPSTTRTTTARSTALAGEGPGDMAASR